MIEKIKLMCLFCLTRIKLKQFFAKEILIDTHICNFYEISPSGKKMVNIFCLICFPDLSTEEQENYFLLCDVLPEDRILREELQKQRLVRIVFKE